MNSIAIFDQYAIIMNHTLEGLKILCKAFQKIGKKNKIYSHLEELNSIKNTFLVDCINIIFDRLPSQLIYDYIHINNIDGKLNFYKNLIKGHSINDPSYKKLKMKIQNNINYLVSDYIEYRVCPNCNIEYEYLNTTSELLCTNCNRIFVIKEILFDNKTNNDNQVKKQNKYDPVSHFTIW